MHTLNGRSHDVFRQSNAREGGPSWDFIAPDPSGRSALSEDPELERYLVEEIARAKRRSPLMRRLAEAGHEIGEPPGASLGAPVGATAPQQQQPFPPPSALASVRPGKADLSMPAEGPKIDPLMGEAFGGDFPRCVSAERRGSPQRASRLIRLPTVLSWIATLAIGAAIVAIALPLQG